jgi:hypothetical protein
MTTRTLTINDIVSNKINAPETSNEQNSSNFTVSFTSDPTSQVMDHRIYSGNINTDSFFAGQLTPIQYVSIPSPVTPYVNGYNSYLDSIESDRAAKEKEIETLKKDNELLLAAFLLTAKTLLNKETADMSIEQITQELLDFFEGGTLDEEKMKWAYEKAKQDLINKGNSF